MAIVNSGIKRSPSLEGRVLTIMDTLEKDFVESLKPFSTEGSNTFAGLGGSGQVSPNQGQVAGAYLPTAGGQMIGPISFYAQLQTIASDHINITKETGDYTSYLIVDAEGVSVTDQIKFIDGAEKSQQILIIRGIIGQTITIVHDSSGVGTTSNIITPNAANFALQGDKTIVLFLDSADNHWHFLADGVYKDIYDRIASGGSGADRQLSNLISPTLINQALVPVNDGLLDLGGPFNYWDDVWCKTVKLRNTGLISTSDPMICADTLNGVRINFVSTSTFQLYRSGNKFIEMDNTVWKPIPDNSIDLGIDSTNRFKNGYFRGLMKSATATIENSLLVNSTFSVTSGVFAVNVPTTADIFAAVLTLHASTIAIGNISSDDIKFNGRMATSLIPKTAGLYDIGSVTNQLRDGYFVGTLHTETIECDGPLDMSGGGVNDDIILGGANFLQVGSTVSSASSGSRTLPSNPAGFLRFKTPGGAIVSVPYYN